MTRYSPRRHGRRTQSRRRSSTSAGSRSSPSRGRGRWRSSSCAMRSRTPPTARRCFASASCSAGSGGPLRASSSGSWSAAGRWAIPATRPRSGRSCASEYRMRSHAHFPKARRQRRRCIARRYGRQARHRCISCGDTEIERKKKIIPKHPPPLPGETFFPPISCWSPQPLNMLLLDCADYCQPPSLSFFCYVIFLRLLSFFQSHRITHTKIPRYLKHVHFLLSRRNPDSSRRRVETR